MRSRIAARKYRTLLASLVAVVLLFPLLHGAPETRAILRLVLSLVFVAALLAVFPDRRLRGVATLLGAPTLVGLWTDFLVPGVPRVPLAIAFHASAAVFFGFTIGAILWNLHREEGVSADGVYGAFCGYLLAGLAFGNLFNVVEVAHPGSFRGEEFVREMTDDRRHFLLTYFSFITLTTVGYGDISPGSDGARGLAAVEALVGQFYIAVLVAELIGKRVSPAVTGRDSDPAAVVPQGARPEAPPE